MNKKWAEDYSSDEGEQEAHEGDLVSDDEKEPAKEAAPMEDGSATTGFIAYVSDISFSASREDVGFYFERLGCNITKLDLLTHPNGRSLGNAVIEFEDSNSLDVCLQASGSEIFGRKIRTSLNNDAFMKHDRRPDNRSDRGGGRGGRGGYNDRDNRTSREHRDYRESRDSGGRGDYRDRRSDRQQDRGQDSRGDRSQQDARFGRQTETRQQPRSNPGAPRPADRLEAAISASAPLAERPKLVLAPRTVPLESVGQPTSKSSIFGEGHANDNLAYEKKKATAAAVVKTEPVPDVSSVSLSGAPPAISSAGVESSIATATPPVPPTTSEGTSTAPRKNNNREREPREDRERGGRGSGGRGDRRENKTRAATAPVSDEKQLTEGAEDSAAVAGEVSSNNRRGGDRDRGEGGKQGARIFNSAVNAAGAGKNQQSNSSQRQQGRGGDRDRKPAREKV